MKIFSHLLIVTFTATLAAGQTPAAATPTAEAKRQVVSAVAKHLREKYVDQALGDALAVELERKLRGGVYDRIASGPDLAARITADLQSMSRDKHLRLTYSDKQAEAPRSAETAASREERRARFVRLGGEVNYGFRSAEILAGNIGYLALDGFWHLEFGGGDTAAATMTFLAQSDALIIDLRESTRGGDPEMALLIASYFFQEQVHLSDFYSRPTNEMRQWWTLAWVPGQRYLDKPIFILTSEKTFSAGEGFAYDLQATKRAMVIGERTAGASHPAEEYELTPNFTLELPFARSINRVTKTDWEGTGVVPDVPTHAASALDVARLKAIELLMDRPASSRLAEERKATLAELLKRLGR